MVRTLFRRRYGRPRPLAVASPPSRSRSCSTLAGCATRFDAVGNPIYGWQFGQDTSATSTTRIPACRSCRSRARDRALAVPEPVSIQGSVAVLARSSLRPEAATSSPSAIMRSVLLSCEPTARCRACLLLALTLATAAALPPRADAQPSTPAPSAGVTLHHADDAIRYRVQQRPARAPSRGRRRRGRRGACGCGRDVAARGRGRARRRRRARRRLARRGVERAARGDVATCVGGRRQRERDAARTDGGTKSSRHPPDAPRVRGRTWRATRSPPPRRRRPRASLDAVARGLTTFRA